MSEAFAGRPVLPANGQAKVNIGCGALHRDGWLNIDSRPAEDVYYVNVINGLPLPDAAACHIHCEHFLEHLELEDARKFIGECFRILGPGGGIRIIVPDAAKYMTAYACGDVGFFDRLRCLGGDPIPMGTPIEVINRMFRMWGSHRFAWDFELLAGMLRATGFSSVSRSKLGDVANDLNIDGQDWWRPLESLYVNALK